MTPVSQQFPIDVLPTSSSHGKTKAEQLNNFAKIRK